MSSYFRMLLVYHAHKVSLCNLIHKRESGEDGTPYSPERAQWLCPHIHTTTPRLVEYPG